MALPEFIKSATGLEDGAVNNLAAGLAKMKKAQYETFLTLRDVSEVFSTLDAGDLPLLPSAQDLETKSNEIENEVNTKIETLEDLGDLTGTCLSSGVGATTSIAKNAFGFIEDSVDLYSSVTNMPSQMFDIYKIYSKSQEFMASLGVDKLVAGINSKLGCISDSSMIADTQAEVANIVNQMGLDSSGQVNGTTYYEKIKRELEVYGADNGIGTGFTDQMSAGLGGMSDKTNGFAVTTADAANAEIDALKQSAKDSLDKVPLPPSFF